MISLARIFQNGMILQRNKPISLFGESDLSQTLSVKINGISVLEGIEVNGHFCLVLPPQIEQENATLIIEGSNDKLVFERVDIGEVWVAGGQSNMEFLLEYDCEGSSVIANANDDHIRFYNVGEYAYEGAEDEGIKDNAGWDRWMSFQPDSAGYFSAVGAYFAITVRKKYDIPVGVVGCNWGGTSASCWMSEEYLLAKPELQVYLNEYKQQTADLDMDKYLRNANEATVYMNSPAVKRNMEKMLRGTLSIADKSLIIKESKNVSAFMQNTVGPHSPYRPCGLYHNMVKQIAGYTCRGFLWYQGESDDTKADIYDSLFASLIQCWRDTWNENLAFLFVQLAPFGKWLWQTGEFFPQIREKQEWVSKNIPKTYMISIMDAGMENDIHPKRKRPVGERLALMAMGKIYGENVLCDPPELSDVQLNKGKMTLVFNHSGEGLTQKGKKLQAFQLYVDGNEVKKVSFEVRGNCITLSASELSDEREISIQFANTGYCVVNLYSSAGLAAKPFAWSNRCAN